MTTWMIVIAIVVAIVALLSVPLTISIRVDADHKGFEFNSRVHVMGILLFRKQIQSSFSKHRLDDKSDLPPNSTKVNPSPVFFRLLPVIDDVLNLLTIKKWVWNLEVGVGDAALTGWMVGFLYALTGIFTSFLYTKIRFQSLPMTTVIPCFHQSVLRTDLYCIVKSRLGKAIYAAIRIFLSMQRRGAHGGSSNPVADVHHA